MTDRDLADQLAGFSLTTAEILYRLPDHPSLLQSYVWQEYDLHPTFPRLSGFLAFWTDNIEGRIYRIRIAHARLLTPKEIRCLAGDLSIN